MGLYEYRIVYVIVVLFIYVRELYLSKEIWYVWINIGKIFLRKNS